MYLCLYVCTCMYVHVCIPSFSSQEGGLGHFLKPPKTFWVHTAILILSKNGELYLYAYKTPKHVKVHDLCSCNLCSY